MEKAKWLDDSTKESTFKCSNCGKEPLYERGNNKLAYPCLSLYCPHCGCEMELDTDKLFGE